MPPIFIANWKMNGSRQMLTEWLHALRDAALDPKATLVLCPPSPYLDMAAALAQALHLPLSIGAQNVHGEPKGAFTGEVSVAILQDVGCRYVLVGHSERRRLFHENDTLVAQKSLAAQQANLIPIVCVGETQEERNLGLTQGIVETQLNAVLTHAGPSCFNGAIIAYEPLWAIGTGVTATPEQAQTVHAGIRSWLQQKIKGASLVPLIYGGSVTPDNASQLMQQLDIQGLLVGGASLKASDFLSIINA